MCDFFGFLMFKNQELEICMCDGKNK